MHLLRHLVSIFLLIFITQNALCATKYVTRSKKYYNPEIAKKYIAEANKFKADAEKETKAGNTKFAEALTKIYECKLRIAEGYEKGDRSKIRVGEKTCEDALEEYKKIQKESAPEVVKAEAKEDAKDFIKAAKYRKFANAAYSVAVKFKRKGNEELAKKMLDRSNLFLKLSNAYKTGDVAVINECETALGHKKTETEKK